MTITLSQTESVEYVKYARLFKIAEADSHNMVVTADEYNFVNDRVTELLAEIDTLKMAIDSQPTVITPSVADFKRVAVADAYDSQQPEHQQVEQFTNPPVRPKGIPRGPYKFTWIDDDILIAAGNATTASESSYSTALNKLGNSSKSPTDKAVRKRLTKLGYTVSNGLIIKDTHGN